MDEMTSSLNMKGKFSLTGFGELRINKRDVRSNQYSESVAISDTWFVICQGDVVFRPSEGFEHAIYNYKDEGDVTEASDFKV